jgi:hypothetical protein
VEKVVSVPNDLAFAMAQKRLRFACALAQSTQWEHLMSKGMDSKKQTKKEPLKTAKEKKAAKKEKKASK